MSTSPSDSKSVSILAFGAHPDDVEFGVGGVLVSEAGRGRSIHVVVCSSGEAGTNGTPAERTVEAQRAAALMGASIEFIEMGGDSNIESTRSGARRIAEVIRRCRPEVVLAPSLAGNQHPDHVAVATMVRDAARLARFGGIAELASWSTHAIKHLLFYAVSPSGTPEGLPPVVYALDDASVEVWERVMAAHESQMRTRDYVSLQLARARFVGLRTGAGHGIELYPNDPLLIDDLGGLGFGSRRF